jgi:Putative heavy-metal-binding
MRISSTDVIEGGRVLYAIGKIKAASAWHAANGAPLQDNWRELVLNELIRRAEDIDADAIIGLDYETDGIVPVEETGVQLKRILATGVAVKLSCVA